MKLLLPKEDMRLDILLQTFKIATEKVGFEYSKSRGRSGEFNFARFTRQIPNYVNIHKPGFLDTICSEVISETDGC